MSRTLNSAWHASAWPTPVLDPQTPADAVRNLRHTLAVFGDRETDSTLLIMATSNIYGAGIRTGLTWRDLELIAEALDDAP